jgi:hypothetical protein
VNISNRKQQPELIIILTFSVVPQWEGSELLQVGEWLLHEQKRQLALVLIWISAILPVKSQGAKKTTYEAI